MAKEMTISEYLIQSLQRWVLPYIWHPGDYVVKFFSELEKSPIEAVTTCSEQGSCFCRGRVIRVLTVSVRYASLIA